jgi:HPr kinase/phosphorylase
MTPLTGSVTVGALVRNRPDTVGLGIRLVAGAAGLEREITSPYVQKTGLALAGFDEYLHVGRVLIFGESEVFYLASLSPTEQRERVFHALARGIPCILLTADLDPPPELGIEAEKAGVALLKTALPTPVAIARLTLLLEDWLAERVLLHSVLMDILGLGVLIAGESGIGKSECALDLILRGHRLVADDTVEVRRRADTVLIGTCPELTRHHMEVRGLGIINIRQLFGVGSTRSSKRVEMVVQLERWEPGRPYERLGLDDVFYEVLGIRIPLIRMPVAPGRSLANLVEVAARNQLLRARGHHAARRLAERLDRRLAGQPEENKDIDDIEDDFGDTEETP